MRHDARDMRGAAAWRLCASAARSTVRYTLTLALVASSAIATKEALHTPASHSAPAQQSHRPIPLVAMTNMHAASAPSAMTRREHLAPTSSATNTASANDEDIRYFNGRKVRVARVLRMRVTAYSPDAQSCGEWADGITASNKSVWTNAGKLVAADTSILPLGSLVSIPGYDESRVVPVLDRGGAIKGARLDALYPTHETAMEWGVQDLDVTIWEYVDETPAVR